MEDFKLDPRIAEKVEKLCLLAKECQEVNKKYKSVWIMLAKQFFLKDFNYDVPDNPESFKLKLYAELKDQMRTECDLKMENDGFSPELKPPKLITSIVEIRENPGKKKPIEIKK